MRNRLRIEVEKNGARVGVIGCADRGVLGVWLDLVDGRINGHVIDVPGDPEPDEEAWWSFGRAAVGDVITLRLIGGGRLSRPDKRERHDLKRDVASTKRSIVSRDVAANSCQRLANNLAAC